MDPPRVLSIQSHVVHGHVGQKSSVFPLQLHGHDVDVINSVHFSNHTGYTGGFQGTVLQGAELLAILQGLVSNKLFSADILLTGYIGSKSFLQAVLTVLKTLKSTNPNALYFCDPVLGDNGKFYVPEELVGIYKAEVLPQADVVTPNEFEVLKLTGIEVTDLATAKLACRSLHEVGPSIVVITSVSFKSTSPDRLTVVASSAKLKKCWTCTTPVVPGKYTGTGDLFTALLLAWYAKLDNDLPRALEKVVQSLFFIIKNTHEHGGSGSELRLIQSKEILERGGGGLAETEELLAEGFFVARLENENLFKGSK